MATPNNGHSLKRLNCHIFIQQWIAKFQLYSCYINACTTHNRNPFRMRSDGKTSLLRTLADFSCLKWTREKKVYRSFCNWTVLTMGNKWLLYTSNLARATVFLFIVDVFFFACFNIIRKVGTWCTEHSFSNKTRANDEWLCNAILCAQLARVLDMSVTENWQWMFLSLASNQCGAEICNEFERLQMQRYWCNATNSFRFQMNQNACSYYSTVNFQSTLLFVKIGSLGAHWIAGQNWQAH